MRVKKTQIIFHEINQQPKNFFKFNILTQSAVCNVNLYMLTGQHNHYLLLTLIFMQLNIPTQSTVFSVNSHMLTVQHLHKHYLLLTLIFIYLNIQKQPTVFNVNLHRLKVHPP